MKGMFFLHPRQWTWNDECARIWKAQNVIAGLSNSYWERGWKEKSNFGFYFWLDFAYSYLLFFLLLRPKCSWLPFHYTGFYLQLSSSGGSSYTVTSSIVPFTEEQNRSIHWCLQKDGWVIIIFLEPRFQDLSTRTRAAIQNSSSVRKWKLGKKGEKWRRKVKLGSWRAH